MFWYIRTHPMVKCDYCSSAMCSMISVTNSYGRTKKSDHIVKMAFAVFLLCAKVFITKLLALSIY